MKDIPIETLNQIFDHLSQEDHTECMLVCHLWKEAIEDHCLFRNLRIYSTGSFKSFIKKIHDRPALRRNVKYLTCYFDDHSSLNLAKSLEPLYNLRSFKCFGPNYGNLLMDDEIDFSWRISIETLYQQRFYPIINPIFATNVFPRMTVLDVCDPDDNILFHSLKNAPALKNLTLRFGKFSFSRLDSLHESLPNLNLLTLKYKTILDDTFYKFTAPAKSMTEFDFDSVTTSSIQHRIDVLRYIKVKYPNLVRLKLDEDFFGTSKSETDQLYSRGWGPLLHSLGSQLNELQVCYENEVQSFLDMLDINRCQIQTLYIAAVPPCTVFPNIAQSQQALYVKTLVLDRIKPGTLDWLRELKVLKSLDVGIHRHAEPLPFNFNKFIENCPDSLLSLSLTNADITLELVSAIQCNAKTLILAGCNLPQKTDRFISGHFPLLSAFTLNNCEFHIKIFNMKALDLQSFCLIQNGCKDPITVLVQTYYDSSKRWYSTRGAKSYHPFTHQQRDFEPTEYPQVISLPASEIKKKPFLTFHCLNMRQIFLCR